VTWTHVQRRHRCRAMPLQEFQQHLVIRHNARSGAVTTGIAARAATGGGIAGSWNRSSHAAIPLAEGTGRMRSRRQRRCNPRLSLKAR
jgi:hypothetical protein